MAEISKNTSTCGVLWVVHSGFVHKFTYFYRTISSFEDNVKQLEDILTYVFLPVLFRSPLTEVKRKLVALLIRHGGLNVNIPSDRALREFSASTTITQDLVQNIKSQSNNIPSDNRVIIKTIKEENESFYYKAKLEDIK